MRMHVSVRSRRLFETTIGLYRENAIAIESEANDSFGGNVYYVTMQITLPIPEFTRNERNFHCDVLHFTPDRVVTLVLDDTIAAIQTSRQRPITCEVKQRCQEVDHSDEYQQALQRVITGPTNIRKHSTSQDVTRIFLFSGRAE